MVVATHGTAEQRRRQVSWTTIRLNSSPGRENMGHRGRGQGSLRAKSSPLLALERTRYGVDGLIDPLRVKRDGVILGLGPAEDLLQLLRHKLGGELAKAGDSIAFGENDVDRELKGQRLSDLLQALLNESSAFDQSCMRRALGPVRSLAVWRGECRRGDEQDDD